MLRVFLSSTFKDLLAERAAVEAALQRSSLLFIGMEYFGSFSEEPLEKCLQKVRSSDILVLVVGERYGFVPKTSNISMTESEYREALVHKVPVLPYMLEEVVADSAVLDLADTPSSQTQAEIAASTAQLDRFKQELRSNHGVTEFSSPEDLAWKVVSDIAREFAGRLSGTTPEAVRNDFLLDPFRQRLEELISILEQRASRINAELSRFYRYAAVKKYLTDFENLHRQHVTALRSGNVILAHEILGRIHDISRDLESNEFWSRQRAKKPGMLYRLRRDQFERGRLICGYIAGDMTPRSSRYPSSERTLSLLPHHKPSPTDAAKMYSVVLNTEA